MIVCKKLNIEDSNRGQKLKILSKKLKIHQKIVMNNLSGKFISKIFREYLKTNFGPIKA